MGADGKRNCQFVNTRIHVISFLLLLLLFLFPRYFLTWSNQQVLLEDTSYWESISHLLEIPCYQICQVLLLLFQVLRHLILEIQVVYLEDGQYFQNLIWEESTNNSNPFSSQDISSKVSHRTQIKNRHLNWNPRLLV